jgi:AraC family transcriptional regulator, regulatory protein of adaptative response / DNA-3-methyladenine glycosylase II
MRVDHSPSALATRAAERIESGALDEGSLETLASELGTSSRTLRRALRSELGLAPIELAQARRLALARELLRASALPLTEIAFASGFRSLRRFQAAFRAAHGCAPSAVRRKTTRATSESVLLRLAYRPPYDWPARLAQLEREALPHCELVEGLVWSRSVRIGARTGWVAVYPARRGHALTAEIALPLVRALRPLVARLRRRLALDIDGSRGLGSFDDFEPQLVALAPGARSALVERFGRRFAMPHAILTRLAPDAAALAASTEGELRVLGLAPGQARALLVAARTMVVEPERKPQCPSR